MLTKIKRRLHILLVALFRPEFTRLDARLDNVEAALHRDVDELTKSIEERAFVIAELVVRTHLGDEGGRAGRST